MRVWSEPGADKLKFNFLCFHVKFDSSELLNAFNCSWLVGWLVGCFGLNGPFRQYFSLYRAVFQREGEREEKG